MVHLYKDALKQVGKNSLDLQTFFSKTTQIPATLSELCIQHDELGWLGAGITVKL